MRVEQDVLRDQIRSLSPSERGYIAGVIDGEGCITARNDPSVRQGRKFWGYIGVTNTDPRMVLWLRDRIGGHITIQHSERISGKDGKPWKRAYVWRLSMRQAEVLLKEMMPLLVVKKDQAEAFCSLMTMIGNRRGKGRAYKITEGDISCREAAILKLRNLKETEVAYAVN